MIHIVLILFLCHMDCQQYFILHRKLAKGKWWKRTNETINVALVLFFDQDKNKWENVEEK